MMTIADIAGDGERGGNGTLLCVFESTESGMFSINRVISRDDGYTWGERRRVYTAAPRKSAGAPQVINVGGTLVVSFMTNEDVEMPGGASSVDGGQMKIVTSIDGGQTWSTGGIGSKHGTSQKALAVVGGDREVHGELGGIHWPGLYRLDNDSFLVFYSRAGWAAGVSHKFKLAW
ncbi:bnr asp-box repeat domain protein [Podospora australis]|uniref:Bnr asp-box repeat domain protein n=1 Tax=Podospora australis TaxID=1536484 RepID=A0AAN7ACZ6_9PEZI|nr:bnr asp-box repeat domain protein [Podospora australis]